LMKGTFMGLSPYEGHLHQERAGWVRIKKRAGWVRRTIKRGPGRVRRTIERVRPGRG